MRKYARKPDSPDPRDYRFVPSQMGAVSSTPPLSMDLRPMFPPAFDQGDEGSCGANSMSAFDCLMFKTTTPFSRHQIYYCTRILENNVNVDDGVETRNLFKVMQKTGAVPEPMWPYVQTNLFMAPPVSVLSVASKNCFARYQRLIGEDDMVACLSEGFPFVLGINLYSSFEGDALARTGVMSVPDVRRETYVGGHDVLVVGYDLKFRKSSVFKRSGVDPTLVSDHALLIRNSWSAQWGIQGHFWMPMSYAVNPSTGGDSWTGRL